MKIVFFTLIFCVLTIVSLPLLRADDSILIIRLDDQLHEQTAGIMEEELHDIFAIKESIIDKTTSKTDIAATVKQASPRLVVLMDNIAINLYKQYQSDLPPGSRFIPTVSLMASFLDLSIKGIKNATGISYEIPVSTSAVELRHTLDIPINKIGIVHREFMSSSIQKDKINCAKENIELISYEIPDSERRIRAKLRKGLKTVIKQVDALWVPNDNNIVNAMLLKTVWIPIVKQYRIPIITGIENLVGPEIDFGTFAIIPDNISLGLQASEMIFNVMDNHWNAEEFGIEPPSSVYRIINIHQVKSMIDVDEKRVLDIVDKVVPDQS